MTVTEVPHLEREVSFFSPFFSTLAVPLLANVVERLFVEMVCYGFDQTNKPTEGTR